MAFTGRIAASDKVKVVLAIPLNSTTTAAYARQYSQLSLTSPFLAEISIDDFADQYRALAKVVLEPGCGGRTSNRECKNRQPQAGIRGDSLRK